jgi:hypothetical protein
MTDTDQILHLLTVCTDEQRKAIFQALRQEFPIHPLEQEWHVSAEVILEAISRSSDLSKRGVKGLIAEAAFGVDVAAMLPDWTSIPVTGDHAYDYLLADATGQVRVQVKMQRRVEGVPMTADRVRRNYPPEMFVVETQRTRTGKATTGDATRPYRFGGFDILAVCMYPSTHEWSKFTYTVANWLAPRSNAPDQIAVLQLVSPMPNDDWTDDFLTCVTWLRTQNRRTIYPGTTITPSSQ